MRTESQTPRLRGMSRELTIAVGAVVAIAFGLSHPYMLSLAGLDSGRQRAEALGLDRMPTNAIAPAGSERAKRQTAARGLTGLRAAIREQR